MQALPYCNNFAWLEQLDHIEFKRNQLNKLEKLKDEKLMDDTIGSRESTVSIAEMKPLEFEHYINELNDIIEDFAKIEIEDLDYYDSNHLNDTRLFKIVGKTSERKIFKKKYKYVNYDFI